MEAFEVWSKPTTASPARAEEASRALRRWTKSAFPHVACLPNTATSSHAGKCEADDVPAPPDMEVDDDPWDQRAERQPKNTSQRVKAAAYLAQAVVFLYKAIDYDGLECPNNSPVGCAASVAGFITSITWIASYLSFAANACGQAVNNGALCAGDFTALMANFGEIATVGAAARADCDFGKNALQILTRWKEFVPAGASPAVDKALKVKGHKDQQRNRDYDIVQCAADVTNSVSYIVRAILQIRAAGSACPDPKSCAVGIMNIISSFAWISQFTALAVSDCQVAADQKALCTADISDMVAALTNGPAAGIASTSDCVTMIHPYPEVEGSKPLSDGGLYLGGSLAGAQAFVEEGTGSSLRIRFFLNRIEWNKGAALSLQGLGFRV
ncbi:unnamed protein product [Symbiodinium microadriaticum]|nr:unnamed protein product [Symbiodinium microadriaticum]CAE7675412.1 unnamed protein product [Symbiodinium sp. KB8]